MSEQETTHQLEGLEELIAEGRTDEAAALIADAHPTDAAEALQSLDAPDIAEVLLRLDRERAADILEELPDDLAADAVERISAKEAAAIVSEMQSDEEADVLHEVSEDHVEAILGHLDTAEAAETREMLAYGEDTAGGLMQKEYIAVPTDWVARDVVRMLRRKAKEIASYPASYLYAVDDQRRLRGIISLRALLLCDAQTPISEIMTPDPVAVPATTPGEELLKEFRRHHFLAIPVTAEDGLLLGIVTQEDALRFEIEEGDEELLRFSGIAGGEEVRDMPLPIRARQRLVWLSVKLVLNIGVASVVAAYTDTISALPFLVALMPIISDMGGSAGHQAIAVSIRELSVGRIKPDEFGWVLMKEIGVGLLNGLVLGVLIGLGAWLWQQNPALGMVVGAALFLNTIVAVSLGSMLPLLMRRLQVDPAATSGPFLTMLTDMCGFFLVLAFATQFMRYLQP